MGRYSLATVAQWPLFYLVKSKNVHALKKKPFNFGTQKKSEWVSRPSIRWSAENHHHLLAVGIPQMHSTTIYRFLKHKPLICEEVSELSVTIQSPGILSNPRFALANGLKDLDIP
jgi:hypothetical protein